MRVEFHAIDYFYLTEEEYAEVSDILDLLPEKEASKFISEAIIEKDIRDKRKEQFKQALFKEVMEGNSIDEVAKGNLVEEVGRKLLLDQSITKRNPSHKKD